MRVLASSAAVLLASVCGAQDLASNAGDLAHLRAAFDAWSTDSCAFVIAVVKGRKPVILCHGNDTHGKQAHPLTYTPLGSVARLLIADAIHVKLDGKLDAPAGTTVGGKEPTVLALLQGTDSLPDYWDWRTDSQPVTVANLLACADTAADAGFKFGWSRAGTAGLMLLEQRFLGGKTGDWPSLTRVMLAPRVSGLDPRDAGNLTDEDWAKLSVSSTIAQRAKPAALRLMVTSKGLANWWQWRIRTPMPLWKGLRMGYRGKVSRREGVVVWSFEDFGTNPVKSLAITYPQHRSGIICISTGPTKWIPGQASSLIDAFAADLFGELPKLAEGMWGARAGRNARPPLARWKGKRWATRADAAQPCEIRIENATHQGLRLELAGQASSSVQVLSKGASLRVVTNIDQERGGVLWLWPRPRARDPKHLVAVFVARDALSVVPHLLKLALKPAPGRGRLPR